MILYFTLLAGGNLFFGCPIEYKYTYGTIYLFRHRDDRRRSFQG
jgi:hypothetical protein